MERIILQIQYLLASFFCGIILFFVYDFFHVVRKLIKHSRFIVFLEDLFFWSAASIFVFLMVFQRNNGILRGFAILAFSLGMMLYYFLAGNRFSSWLAGLIHKILYPVFRVVKKVYKKVKYLLKKLRKTFIIAIQSKLQR